MSRVRSPSGSADGTTGGSSSSVSNERVNSSPEEGSIGGVGSSDEIGSVGAGASSSFFAAA